MTIMISEAFLSLPDPPESSKQKRLPRMCMNADETHENLLWQMLSCSCHDSTATAPSKVPQIKIQLEEILDRTQQAVNECSLLV